MRKTAAPAAAPTVQVQHGIRTPDGTLHWGEFTLVRRSYQLDKPSHLARLAGALGKAASGLGMSADDLLGAYMLVTREVVITHGEAVADKPLSELTAETDAADGADETEGAAPAAEADKE